MLEEAQHLYQTGLLFHRTGSFSKAVKAFTQALAVDSSAAEIFFARGQAYAAQNKDDAALADFRNTIALNPDYFDAYYESGVILQNADPQAALEEYSLVLDRNPTHQSALSARGMVYYFAGHYDAALKDFSTLITVTPDHDLPYINRGRVFYALERQKDAIVDFYQGFKRNTQMTLEQIWVRPLTQVTLDIEQFIVLYPGAYEGYVLRAVLSNADHQHQAALQDLSNAISINPDEAVLYLFRGNTYRVIRDYERAMSDLNRAVSKLKHSPDPYVSRGMLYAVQNQLDAALVDLEQAIEFTSGIFQKQELKNLIQQLKSKS